MKRLVHLEEKLTSTQAPFLLSQWQQKPHCSHLADDPQTSWEFSVKKDVSCTVNITHP
jgi:hypothetical protein